jgi:biotin carboxylase
VIPGMEYAVPFAARLAQRYRVPGAGPAAADVLRDKAALRAVTGAAGIANPRSRPVDGPGAVRAFMAEEGGPVVLKPANRQGSLGTRILFDRDEVDEAWAECVVQDEGALVPRRGLPLRMLVEQYVEGDELSVEMVVRDGVPVFANVTSKVLFPGPRPVERGHVVPAELPAGQRQLLIGQTERVLEAVGFGTGFVHCEWILSGGTPVLVECAGRLPGDGIVELITRAWQLDAVGLYLSVMNGRALPAGLPHHPSRGAAVWFLHAEPGLVEGVDGVDLAASVPGVVGVVVTLQRGSQVRKLRSSGERVGAVTACAATAPEALRSAQQAAAAIKVTTSATAPDPGCLLAMDRR